LKSIPSVSAPAALALPSARVVAWRVPSRLAELARYFLASVLALALDLLVLTALVERAAWPVQAAAAAGFAAGTVLAFVLSLGWVFRQRAFSHWHQGLLRFALVGVLGLGLNAALMAAFHHGLSLDYRLAKLGAAAFSFLFNYAARRLWLFSCRGVGAAA